MFDLRSHDCCLGRVTPFSPPASHIDGTVFAHCSPSRLHTVGTFLGIESPNLFRSGFRRFVFSIIIMLIVLFFSKGLMGDKEISFGRLIKRFKKTKPVKTAKGGGIDA